MKCINCGYEINDQFQKKCPLCGKPLVLKEVKVMQQSEPIPTPSQSEPDKQEDVQTESQKRFCPQCGAPMFIDDRFCSKCGCDTQRGMHHIPESSEEEEDTTIKSPIQETVVDTYVEDSPVEAHPKSDTYIKTEDDEDNPNNGAYIPYENDDQEAIPPTKDSSRSSWTIFIAVGIVSILFGALLCFIAN